MHALIQMAGSCALKSFGGLVIEMNFHCLREHAVFFQAAEQKEMRVSWRETEYPQLRNEHSGM